MNDLIDKIPGLTRTSYKGDGYELKNIEGTIVLPAWKDFQVKKEIQGPGGDLVRLDIGGDMVVDDPVVTEEHVNAYNYLLQDQEKIKDNILASLLSQYKEIQEQYGYDDDDAASIMPDVNDVKGFQSLISLSSIHLLNVYKDGYAYAGYAFNCSWDEEHGLGVMTYKDRIIEIGTVDTSFLTWIAENDLDPSKEEPNEGQDEEPGKEKPWWKIW